MRTQTPFPGVPEAPWYVSSELFAALGSDGPVEGLAAAAVATLARDRPIRAAWAVLGRVGDPERGVAFDVDEDQLLALEPAGFTAADEATANASIERLAVALGVHGDQVDPHGEGPFGTITVRSD